MLAFLVVAACCCVIVRGSCPILYGATEPSDVPLEGLRLYLDLNDEELTSVSSLQIFGNPDGTVDIINNGIVEGVFGIAELIRTVPPIPGTIQSIPIYIESLNKVYYSLSVISQNTTILESFSDVYPNAELIDSDEVRNLTISFCCKENGTVLLQGCLTVTTEPFEQASPDHVTINPFYALYQCIVPMPPVDCSESLSVTSTKVEFCFTSNQSAALILTGQEGWGVIGNVGSICGISSAGVNRFLSNDEDSRRLPIGKNFSMLDFFFDRAVSGWTTPTYYSMSFNPRNTSVLDPFNATIPFQGTFDEDDLYFTLFMPCVSNGGTFVDTQLNTSGLIDDYVVNNSFTFFFYKICMPDNITEDVKIAKSPVNLTILIPSIIVPTVAVLVTILVITSIVIIYTVRKKEQVQLLEQLAGNVANSYNAYAFATIYNPFEFLEIENIEYNYAAIDVINKLGEGFFGTVYKARAPGLSRKEHVAGEFVAIKTLKESDDPNSLNNFAKELQTCLKFDHPNVIRLLGVCTISVEKCMIFEFMDLGSLDYCLRASNPDDEDYDPAGFHLSTKDLISIVLQLAKALDYLSSLNFIHRDIAARNCLLNTQLTAKIADFGLSRNLNAQNYYRIGGGKKSYLPIRWMPPEAVLYGKFTLKSDVWSFGILIWEIYTFGRLPYTGLSNHEVIDFIKERRLLNQPDACPLGVYDIMRSCWTRLPSQRSMMSEVVRRLTLFAEGKVDETRNYVNLIPTDT